MKTRILAALLAVSLMGGLLAFAKDEQLAMKMDAVTERFIALAVDDGTTEDADYRFELFADGEMRWGDGTNAQDVVLERTGSGVIDLSTGSLAIGGTTITATAAELNAAADISAAFEDVTAANTLTSAECGKTMTLNSATEFASTLPAPVAGCYFKFIVKAAPSGASYTIVTNGGADIMIGGVNELEVDTADDGPYDNNADTITLVDSVAVVGDYIEMISDGTSWYFNGQTNADGGVTTSTS